MKRIPLTAWLLAALAAIVAFPTGATSAERLPPKAQVTVIEKEWHANLRAGVRADPRRQFQNPSLATLASRLRLAARRYRFTVVKVEIFHPRQAAPLVVIQAKDRHALAASVPAIRKLIDPKKRTNDDRTGWAYEGFLLEALDGRGIPFVAVHNWWRGPHAGGGQWAVDPSLYPYPHG
jgi:hypothetical protein